MVSFVAHVSPFHQISWKLVEYFFLHKPLTNKQEKTSADENINSTEDVIVCSFSDLFHDMTVLEEVYCYIALSYCFCL